MNDTVMPPIGSSRHSHEPHKARGNPPLRRAWLPAMMRGVRSRCPACGEGALFSRLLHVHAQCAGCDEELYHQRADRIALPIAAFVALQVVLLAALVLQLSGLRAPMWIWMLPWGVLFALLTRPVKGAIIGLQWALRLHGFQYAAMCRPRRP